MLLVGEGHPGETDNAMIACNDWLRLGPGRTLPELLNKYNDVQQNAAPTRSLNTLQRWSSRFSWAERATTFDANWETIKTAERTAELGRGLALDYERVRKLKRLADFLEGQIYETAIDALTGRELHINIWVPDKKILGKGEGAEIVDIERFNSGLLNQYRETLNDLAKEVGGRVAKQEIGTPDGKAFPIRVEYVDRPPDLPPLTSTDGDA